MGALLEQLEHATQQIYDLPAARIERGYTHASYALTLEVFRFPLPEDECPAVNPFGLSTHGSLGYVAAALLSHAPRRQQRRHSIVR